MLNHRLRLLAPVLISFLITTPALAQTSTEKLSRQDALNVCQNAIVAASKTKTPNQLNHVLGIQQDNTWLFTWPMGIASHHGKPGALPQQVKCKVDARSGKILNLTVAHDNKQ